MTDLISCNIIEKDINNDILWTWTYPSVTQLQKKILLQKCNFDVVHPFLFGRLRNEWFYLSYTEVFESDNLPWVKHFVLVLWTKDFNPEKYETLCRILSKTYCKTGTPTAVLLLYLSVVTRGSCTTEENGTFLVKDFEWNSTYNNGTMVKDLIKVFGLETILVYTVLLLKKRLVIYHHSLPLLLKWIRTFPALMIHRNDYNTLHPWVNLNSEELVHIKSSSCYIMGCQDSSVASQTELYDVLVNLPAREITVAPHAKESMSMTKAHKEIALFLVQLADKENVTETTIIREIDNKTQELLSQLRSLATVESDDGRKLVTLQVLQERKFSQAVENFLFQLALAENILMI
ncbi:putative DENN domain-containing protein 10 B [Lycorma delicatula]|uniref:putative DENN domain-containing protein 10 B n=1 Tax=Lycorma delicatula TaxID=130591 RepID=UPI003F50E84D